MEQDLVSYINQLPHKIGKAKKSIIELLFEGDWITSKGLSRQTDQKNFDRRIRELKSECGCDIQVINYRTIYYYGLVSFKIDPKHLKRKYLTKKQKEKLFALADYRCNKCGDNTSLQADHKIPLERNGSNDFSNYQALCIGCNLLKRRDCRTCIAISCDGCIWTDDSKIRKSRVKTKPKYGAKQTLLFPKLENT